VASIEAGVEAPGGLVLFAHDGSELATFAIEQAGTQLSTE
jgi:hypothetical protein